MFRCSSCGRDFGTRQALGGHRSMAPSLVLAPAVERALADATRPSGRKGPLSTTHPQATTHPLPTKTDTFPQAATHSLPTHYPLTTRSPLPAAGEDLGLYERRVRDQEVLDKLRRRERQVRGRELRQWGILLVLGGVVLYFLGGGNFKLPFFGSVSD